MSHSLFLVSHFTDRYFFLSFFIHNTQLVILYLNNPLSYTGDKVSNFSFLSFFFAFCIHLQIVFFFFEFPRCQSTNKIVMCFFSFSVGILIFPYELVWGRQFTLCTTDTSVIGSLSQLTCLTFPLFRIRPSCCLVSHGFLGQSAFSLQIGYLLLRAAYQFIHPYSGNLTVNRSVGNIDTNSTHLTSRLLLLVCEGNKEKGKRERDR